MATEYGPVVNDPQCGRWGSPFCNALYQHPANHSPDPITPKMLPRTDYQGAPRLFLLTERTLVDSGSETKFSVVAIALAPLEQIPASATMRWRLLGSGGQWTAATLARAGNWSGWFEGAIDLPASDFEYTVEVDLLVNHILVYPPAGSNSVTVHKL